MSERERGAHFYDLYRTSKERPPINLLSLDSDSIYKRKKRFNSPHRLAAISCLMRFGRSHPATDDALREECWRTQPLGEVLPVVESLIADSGAC